MTPAELASKIDHTILKPEASWLDVQRVILEAKQFRFASACISPCFVKRAAEMLGGSGVLTCTVAGFPAGTSKPTLKAIEASSAVKDGAQEVDVVAHLPFLLAEDLPAAKAELLEVVRAARASNPRTVIKVIVESAALILLGGSRAESIIAKACAAVRESGCDFIKTSTGFHPAGGASVQAVLWMCKYGQGLLVKASGGIRDWPAAKAMLEAGADRLGLSCSVAIIRQLAPANDAMT